MEAERILEEKCRNNPDYLVLTGSKLYGTSISTSDDDFRGFLLPAYEYLIGIKKFKSRDFKDKDYKIHNIEKFLKLVIKGSPGETEILFAPEKNIIKCSDIGKKILSLKRYLISNAIYGRIMGYSTGEWRKSMGTKAIIEKRTQTEDGVINDIRNIFHPDKENMDGIIKILYANREIKIVSSTAGLGVKRKKDIELYGFCRKSAAHSIRLMTQLTELLLTGDILFPRPNANFLLDVRNGKYSKEELQEIHDKVENQAKEARNKSILPDKPNEKKIWEEYKKIVVNSLKSDKRFLDFY